ncbi:uncharacterized protein [Hetaerina americana]|uniref:uncharacterized protein n=1 Tax=Hetaerina americana TaxID=62018 RepID=UPI003A7F4C64
MKKMETLEEVDEYESCRSSVISDLDELEANLYSYVHHERNSNFTEEHSMGFNVSSLEGVCHQEETGVCQQMEILFENVNVGQNSLNNTYADLKSLEGKENHSESSEVNQQGEFVDSACLVTRSQNDSSSCSVQSSGDVAAIQSSDKKANSTDAMFRKNRDSSPSVLEISSSDELDPSEKNASKYRMPVASTPKGLVKEFVVIDDSDEEVQIEFERVKVKSKKKKKRKKSEIKTDIRLNTRISSELVTLDLDEEFTFSEKENVDSLHCGQSYEDSLNVEPLCKSWTPQMVQFYDEPWGGECINISELQRTMSDDGWKVDMSDEFYSLTSKFQNRRYFGVKSKAWCTKCSTKGHYRNECTEKISPPRCYRCGSSRHQEYSCNQKICLTCGRDRPALVVACQQCRQCYGKKCHICQQPGHPPGCCPDLWRRFHATIAPGEIVTPQKVSYKDPKNTYCCNCASRGHHVFQCKKDNFSDYPPMNPKVASYVDPEDLLKFQNTCSRTPTNWENAGCIAPMYQNGDRVKPSSMERGTKRYKSTANQQNSKRRKLSDHTSLTSASNKAVPQKSSKKQVKSVNSEETKKPIGFKIKKGLKTAKSLRKQDKSLSVDDGKHQNQNSELEKDNEHKGTPNMKGPATENGIKGKKTKTINPQTDPTERVIILSPEHLKRIQSEEGKQILKCITDQVKGVTAKVISGPSGVLRLNGSGNIDHFKSNLFDLLNNKCELGQLKQPVNLTSNDIRVKKVNKRKHAVAVRSKNLKKKFQNEAYQNNQLEMRSQDQTNVAVRKSGNLQMKVKGNRTKVKKKIDVVNSQKNSFKNGKGNKLNYKGEQQYRESTLGNDRYNPNCDPVVNHSNESKYWSFGEMSTSSKLKGNSEIFQNNQKMKEEVTHFGTAVPKIGHSLVPFNGNKNGYHKRNNKGYKEMTKDKLRFCRTEGRKNGLQQIGKQPKKLKKNIASGLDKLGLITVEIGQSRKVTLVGESNYDHSRISKNQQCSNNGFSTRHLRTPESTSKEFFPKVS